MAVCCCQNEDEIVVDKQSNISDKGRRVLQRCQPPALLSSQVVEVMVHVNVYSLLEQNKRLKRLGLGVYHTGVVIYGIEWGYGEAVDGANASGLFCVYPGQAAGTLYRTLFLGVTTLSPQQVDTILHRLENEWSSSDYHILNHNCNNFSQRFCDLLSTVQKLQIPKWCNRAARIGSKIVPKRLATYVYRLIDEEPPKAPVPSSSRISELPKSVIPSGWYLHPSVSQGPRYMPLMSPASHPLLQGQHRPLPQHREEKSKEKEIDLVEDMVDAIPSCCGSMKNLEAFDTWPAEVTTDDGDGSDDLDADGQTPDTLPQAHSNPGSVEPKSSASSVTIPSVEQQNLGEVVPAATTDDNLQFEIQKVFVPDPSRLTGESVEETKDVMGADRMTSGTESIFVAADGIIESAKNPPNDDDKPDGCCHTHIIDETKNVAEKEEEKNVVELKKQLIGAVNGIDCFNASAAALPSGTPFPLTPPVTPTSDAKRTQMGDDCNSNEDCVTHPVDSNANLLPETATVEPLITNLTRPVYNLNENPMAIYVEKIVDRFVSSNMFSCSLTYDSEVVDDSLLRGSKNGLDATLLRVIGPDKLGGVLDCSLSEHAVDVGSQVNSVEWEKEKGEVAVEPCDHSAEEEYSDPGNDEDINRQNSKEKGEMAADESSSPTGNPQLTTGGNIVPNPLLKLLGEVQEHQRSQSWPL